MGTDVVRVWTEKYLVECSGTLRGTDPATLLGKPGRLINGPNQSRTENG